MTSTDIFLSAYRIRLIESYIARLYHRQIFRCPVHLSIGQELVAVTACSALSTADTVVSTHRSHAHYLAKGGRLRPLLDELLGLPSGCSGGLGGSMHLTAPDVGFIGSTAILAGSIPIGVGLAFHHKLTNNNNISAIFFGDGATEEGVFYESMNLASLHKLPAVFLCEDNSFSVYTHSSSRRPHGFSLIDLATSLRLTTYELDVTSSHSVAEFYRLISTLRHDSASPLFILIKTYRHLEHCGPDDDIGLEYRDKDIHHHNLMNDPLDELRRKLSSDYSNSFIEPAITAMELDIKNEFNDALAHVGFSGLP